MKGQFMLISSVLVGFIVISAASTISEVQERSFSSDDTRNTVEMIKSAAEKVDHSETREIENFEEMVSTVSGYQTDTVHWRSESCFNVTLTQPGREIRLNCIG
jgi:hypothetical protein